MRKTHHDYGNDGRFPNGDYIKPVIRGLDGVERREFLWNKAEL
ncbi:MAG: hypothetical protein QME73_04170 [Bacillota bacterium]|nr:hypothetical protein [Bacillota bacterium]